jgi:hypothetical protein
MTFGRSSRAVHPLIRGAFALTLLALPLTAGAQALTLSPAVVPLGGHFGQSTRQTLTLTNGTTQELAFELQAQDVIVRDGARVFVAAGEVPGSIAATAVFSARQVSLLPGASASVEVTLTLPPGAEHRAVVVLFRGVTKIRDERGAQATASLGTLLTFSLSEAYSVAASGLLVRPQTSSGNLGFEQSFTNDGREPVVLKGVTAILDATGAIVGKVPSNPHRLLPGERTSLRADYAGELPSGRYRALATFDFAGRALSSAADFEVQ